MPKITATEDTTLKRSVKDSSQLSGDDKISIKKGTVLFVEKIVKSNANHSNITLTFQGWKSGYIFSPHWNLDNGKNLGFIGELKPKPGANIIKLVASKRDYVQQPDSQTCQSAAIAMITGGDVWDIREELTARGVAGDTSVMGNYLRERVKEYKFGDNDSLNDIRKGIDEGYQIITHGNFTGSGHVVKISGYELNPNNLSWSLIVDDPWHEFAAPGWTYAPWSKNGNNVRYSAHACYAALVAGQSTEDAANIYNRGELDSSRPGAWVHYVKT